MKKVLVICNYFAPLNTIAAVRLTKISKYLSILGYEVNVVCVKYDFGRADDLTLKRDLKYINRVNCIDRNNIFILYHKLIAELSAKRNLLSNIDNQNDDISKAIKNNDKFNSIKWLKKLVIKYSKSIFKSINETMRILEEIHTARKAFKMLNEKPDIIISSYGDLFGHYLGLKYKKMYDKVLWIADFRDYVAINGNKVINHYLNRYLEDVLSQADIITAVSSGLMDVLNPTKRHEILTNGYDRDDFGNLKSILKTDKKLHMTYCGQMYGNSRDLSLLWKALSECITDGQIDKKEIVINYAGLDYEFFKSQTDVYEIGSLVINHGYIAREESLMLQKKSDILLLASWNNRDNLGVLTGKFFEYLLMEKPIICVVTGDVPNSTLKEIIMNSNVGVCCEEANINEDYLNLKNYILRSIDEFRINNSISIKYNYDYIKSFDYKNIVSRLNDIINESGT